MASIFTKIVDGEIPCHKVAEDTDHLAFLDIRPVAKGHTLCIPKKEIDYLFDLDDETYKSLMLFSKKVAVSIEKVITCERIGVTVEGLEVPHAHVHLMPFNAGEGVSISKPRMELSNDELVEIASSIKAQFDASNT